MDMSVKIALEMSDGSLAVMRFATRSGSPTLPSGAVWDGPGTWWREPNDENITAEIKKTFPGVNQAGIARPTVVAFHRIEHEDLPPDRKYRNAWRYDKATGKVVHDLGKARELHRQHLRRERTERLVVLDVEWMAATRKKDAVTVAAIDGYKQKLLDVTADPRIDAAQTVEELKQITLPQRP